MLLHDWLYWKLEISYFLMLIFLRGRYFFLKASRSKLSLFSSNQLKVQIFIGALS